MEGSRFLVGALLISSLALASAPKKVERKLYVGKDSVEAEMTFSHEVHLVAPREPAARKALEQVETQINHMFGPMGEASQKAVPRGDHEIENIKVRKTGKDYTITYDFKGTVVVQLVKGKLPPTYKVVLPINPDLIYKQATTASTVRRNLSYACTDSHYNSEGDFWYFWNPSNRGCKLKEGVHYDTVEAKVVGHKNTPISYAEYDRLEKGGEIHISVLMGMDDPEKDRNPLTSRDTNATTFRGIRGDLVKKGFRPTTWTEDQIRAIGGQSTETLPYVEDFEKVYKRARVTVRMFFGPSGIDEQSHFFHHFYKDALEKSALVLYDGHSGLGGHLDLEGIEDARHFKIALPKDRYQLLYFNSCSSYTYYNKQYFARKVTDKDVRGAHNLDIMTNGLATYFTVLHKTNVAIIDAVERWAEDKGWVSYQAIAKTVDSGNLFGVNGDEDNPKEPRL